MKIHVNKEFRYLSEDIEQCILNYSNEGRPFFKTPRNKIKTFKIGEEGRIITIKSFKVPNFFNKLIYGRFRESKAKRSYKYAKYLNNNGLRSPQPLAYAEEIKGPFFLKSYYVCDLLKNDLTYRDLDISIPEHVNILRAYTRYMFKVHEKDVHFLDNSPGNILIELNNGNYLFSLVDLNRMNFEVLDFEQRMENFKRLSRDKEVVAIMANEYAKLIEQSEDEVFSAMWAATSKFWNRYDNKKKLKRRFKFWKQ